MNSNCCKMAKYRSIFVRGNGEFCFADCDAIPLKFGPARQVKTIKGIFPWNLYTYIENNEINKLVKKPHP